jgi:RNA 3'-terminal phosphate cyclase (ATP)
VTSKIDPGFRKGEMLVIDNAGEGGGQIPRTGVALTALLGGPVRFIRIRAGRRWPGLAAQQHLIAVRAAVVLCDATLEGDALTS